MGKEPSIRVAIERIGRAVLGLVATGVGMVHWVGDGNLDGLTLMVVGVILLRIRWEEW